MKEYAVSWHQADEFLRDMNHSDSDMTAFDNLSHSDEFYPILEVTAGPDGKEYELTVEKSDGKLTGSIDQKATFAGELPKDYNLEEEIDI